MFTLHDLFIMASTVKKSKKSNWPVAQFIAIVILTIAVFLIVDFGRRTAIGYRIHQEEKRLEVELTELQTTHEALLTELEYVQSDAYIEEIARNELKMSQVGETVIVVMDTPQSAYKPIQVRIEPVFPNIKVETPIQAWTRFFFPDSKETGFSH